MSRDDVVGALRSYGITPTHQRIEIALALFGRMEHLSADQVMAAVNGRYAETSKATVYNTLKLFVEKRLVRQVIVDPSKVFYDPKHGAASPLLRRRDWRDHRYRRQPVRFRRPPVAAARQTRRRLGHHHPHPRRVG